MANYPQELAQNVVCQSHTGHMTGLWFPPTWPLMPGWQERYSTSVRPKATKELINSEPSSVDAYLDTAQLYWVLLQNTTHIALNARTVTNYERAVLLLIFAPQNLVVTLPTIFPS